MADTQMHSSTYGMLYIMALKIFPLVIFVIIGKHFFHLCQISSNYGGFLPIMAYYLFHSFQLWHVINWELAVLADFYQLCPSMACYTKRLYASFGRFLSIVACCFSPKVLWLIYGM
jgi:hypothetical protein